MSRDSKSKYSLYSLYSNSNLIPSPLSPDTRNESSPAFTFPSVAPLLMPLSGLPFTFPGLPARQGGLLSRHAFPIYYK